MKTWQQQEAKAHLSEVVKQAMNLGPQEITLRGEPAVVVISAAEFHKLNKPQPSFVDFLQSSPLKNMDLQIERDKSKNRNIDL